VRSPMPRLVHPPNDESFEKVNQLLREEETLHRIHVARKGVQVGSYHDGCTHSRPKATGVSVSLESQ
jgi:hypothetical protein